MQVTVEFHGHLREIMGAPVLSLELAGSVVRDVLASLCQLRPPLAAHLPRVACAIDDQIVARDHVLPDGCRLALIPPVSGG